MTLTRFQRYTVHRMVRIVGQAEGGAAIAKTVRIKARYPEGKLEPLEPLELEEGAEVALTVISLGLREARQDPTEATAGAWKDLLDCARFEKEVDASRRIQTRPGQPAHFKGEGGTVPLEGLPPAKATGIAEGGRGPLFQIWTLDKRHFIRTGGRRSEELIAQVNLQLAAVHSSPISRRNRW